MKKLFKTSLTLTIGYSSAAFAEDVRCVFSSDEVFTVEYANQIPGVAKLFRDNGINHGLLIRCKVATIVSTMDLYSDMMLVFPHERFTETYASQTGKNGVITKLNGGRVFSKGGSGIILAEVHSPNKSLSFSSGFWWQTVGGTEVKSHLILVK